jgi:hypothetical protein
VILGAALAPVAAAIAIAVSVAAVPRSPVGHPANSHPPTAALPTVAELAYRASAAALAQPSVGPGQWLYVKVSVMVQSDHYSSGYEAWQTADALKEAAYSNGKLVFRQIIPTYSGDLSYAELTKFRGSPQALANYVFNRVTHSRQLAMYPLQPSTKFLWSLTFGWMAGTLLNFDLPPAVTAEILQAMPYIPGVTVEKVAGGVAFTSSDHSDRDPFGAYEVILDPSSYTVTSILEGDLLSASGAWHAVTSRVPVSGPGVRP